MDLLRILEGMVSNSNRRRLWSEGGFCKRFSKVIRPACPVGIRRHLQRVHLPDRPNQQSPPSSQLDHACNPVFTAKQALDASKLKEMTTLRVVDEENDLAY
jgi:hypothetical protein